jgi:putative Holliday junction resolvase
VAEKIVALDVGLKRIGVAYTPDGKVVVPLKPILRRSRKQASAEVRQLLEEWGADRLVVGVPATNREMERRIRHFISLIGFPGEVEFVDESYTSAIVETQMKGVIKYRRDGRVDSLAAKEILEGYLQARTRGERGGRWPGW